MSLNFKVPPLRRGESFDYRRIVFGFLALRTVLIFHHYGREFALVSDLGFPPPSDYYFSNHAHRCGRVDVVAIRRFGRFGVLTLRFKLVFHPICHVTCANLFIYSARGIGIFFIVLCCSSCRGNLALSPSRSSWTTVPVLTSRWRLRIPTVLASSATCCCQVGHSFHDLFCSRF